MVPFSVTVGMVVAFWMGAVMMMGEALVRLVGWWVGGVPEEALKRELCTRVALTGLYVIVGFFLYALAV